MKASARSWAPQILAPLNDLPHGFYNQVNQLVIDAVAAVLAVYTAFQLRFDLDVPANMRVVMWSWMAAFAIARPLSIRLTGAQKTIWRYFSLRDIPRLLLAVSIPSAALLIDRLGFHTYSGRILAVPMSVIVLDCALFLMAAAALRCLRRAAFEASREKVRTRRALIIGGGATLVAAARHVCANREIQLAGFLTPDSELHGHNLAGVPVLGGPSQFAGQVGRARVDLVFISDATLPNMADMIALASGLGVETRLLPSAENILRGDVRISTQPNLEEAIPRGASQPSFDDPRIAEVYKGRSVLITGAGGSIGSEIARQVARLNVRRLILLDHNETALFEIDRELRASDARQKLDAVVADIRDRQHIESIFAQHNPQIVLHAAAYKHVPMMEDNPPEAVLNNVVGTRNVVETAVAWGAKRFVLISTDKAVHPSSIMGATKRVAEQIVQAEAARHNGSLRTRCAAVRFGNVLGSRGSVAPIFLSQIMAGGPVTVTDEEMTRYFMTIPEAVRLVLQASTLAGHGEIFMLDMGDPVKITALAKKLIEMSGLQPGKDIQIRFTGRRPGEKLHEQLWHDGTVVVPTKITGISAAKDSHVPKDFALQLEKLEAAAKSRDHAVTARRLMVLAGDWSVAAAAISSRPVVVAQQIRPTPVPPRLTPTQ